MLFRLKASKPVLCLKFYSPPQTRLYSTRSSFNPLRILFCGADEFSIHSLRRLDTLQKSRPECINSIDVVCRPDKPVGRRGKQIRQVPIKNTAQSLGLQLHQIDTFTDWTPPPTDLVITVSFGLLVPARILSGAKYGGVNVHPSLLPDLRGPAPIQHALLQDYKQTGVSLQTMHPTQFDRGAILSQQSMHVPENASVEGMVDLLGEMGAELLASGIENGLFIDPKDISTVPGKKLRHAPKITPLDRNIADWKTLTAEEILRRDRVLGKLWDDTTYELCYASGQSKRVTFHDGWRRLDGGEIHIEHRIPWEADDHGGGVVIFRIPNVKGSHFAVETREDNALLAPNAATIEGEKKGFGLQALTRAIKMREV
ncbi:uncharacterized protein RCC_06235 [Ramularia collo-cygni]|uniref:methionyl-tRNA formyltransferase n=1 Tax=Ramularia collo-cygni TaxID=112498 RepID=A0A2D3V0Y4_9PEZI|nr:uncharacterized protein RCC_06235 [Ramularia collo-cygni]CZT20375.1 uncharacterized protein RCC_06235 [Ramularia collo-cygni]